jgi:hypothetical protein
MGDLALGLVNASNQGGDLLLNQDPVACSCACKSTLAKAIGSNCGCASACARAFHNVARLAKPSLFPINTLVSASLQEPTSLRPAPLGPQLGARQAQQPTPADGRIGHWPIETQ